MKILLNSLLLLIITAVFVPVGAADWKGVEVSREGVLHVKNPAEPSSPPVEVAASERWRIGGETEDEDFFFGVIQTIDTDQDGNIYLLDRQLHQVMIYSPEGEFIRNLFQPSNFLRA